MKHAKKAFLASLLSTLLCVTMLIGTTFAWFTDSVTSGGNIIKSGTLDVTVKWADGKDDPADSATVWTDASTGAIFNYDKWEPGYTEVRHIAIANEGTLALKYKVQIVANGTVTDLADAIDVYYFDPAEQIDDRTDLAAYTPMANLTAALAGMSTTATGNLKAGEKDTITIALKMQETAGNAYQDKSIGTDFSVQVLATQYTYEQDSFDDQYDAAAEYPVVSTGSATITGAAAGDLTINSTGEIKSATVPAAAANAVFDDLKDANADSNELTLTLNVTKTGETTTSTGTTVALDIDMTAVMKQTTAGTTVTTTEEVHDLDDYVTINYDLGAGKTNVSVTHNGNAMQELTDLSETVTNTNGAFYYDSASGILTIKTKTFSPFEITYEPSLIEKTQYKAEADGLTVIDTGTTYVIAQDETTKIYYTYYTDGDVYIYDVSEYTGDSLTVPATIKGLNGGSFSDNTTIKTLTFAGDLDYAQKALQGNTTIETVVFDGMTSIPNRLFYGCTGVKNVTATGITRVEDFAFYGNTALENVVLPDTIVYVGYKAFDSCSGLKNLTIYGSPAIMGWAGRGLPSIETIKIYGENATVDLTYAPAGSSKGSFVFVKKGQTNNPGFNDGLTMYVANETVRAAFAAEEACGATMIVNNFPD